MRTQRTQFFPAKPALLGLALLANLLAARPVSGQNLQRLDSLHQAFQKATTVPEQMAALNGLMTEFRTQRPDTVLEIADRAMALAEKAGYEKGRAQVYFQKTLALFNLGKMEKSVENGLKSIETYEKLGDKKLLAGAYHTVVQSLFGLNRYSEATKWELKSLALAQELKDSALMVKCFMGLGHGLSRTNQVEQGKAYIFKALTLATALRQNLYFPYARLGELYATDAQPDSAIFYHQLALEEAKKNNFQLGIAAAKKKIGECYLDKGQIEQGKKYLLDALPFYEKSKNQFSTANLFRRLAMAENAQKNFVAARNYAEKALAALGNEHNVAAISEIHGELAAANAGLGNFELAFQQLKISQTFQDSMVMGERADAVAEAQAKYQTSEQKQVIAEQNLQLERQQNRNRLLLAIALFALVLGAGIALFLREKRRRAELALRLEHAEADRLRELDSVKSAFFANISHEFRTPLTLLLGPLGEMEAGTFRGDLKKYYGIMRRNAARLLQLVNQMLDLSRLESGKLQLQKSSGDLHQLLRVVAGSFESLAEQKQIEFRVDIPAEPFWANFDADKLEKIAANLLSNAFKFTHEEGIVTFAVNTDFASGKVDLRVSDTGIGIAPAQLPHVFERFYQIENSDSDSQAGSGIGLALTKELVGLHGGQITAQSVENQGSTFAVSFVFEKTEAADTTDLSTFKKLTNLEPAVPTDLSTSKKLTKLSPKTSPLVLVAEDNPDVRAYIVEHLRETYQILEARDGQQALELATENIPDLLLTDLMMPGLNGTELTQKLKADPRTNHIPVVMLTAKSGRDDKIAGIETGAEAYLTKPFDGEELHATLANLLAQRRVLQEKFSRQIRLDAPAPAVQSLDEQFLQNVLANIEQNLEDEAFSVETLASTVAMSRSNLFRKLEALLGKSPNQLIRERRLLRAKSLLEQGAGNSTEIAYRTGFNSPSYFAKCFQEMFGVVPGAVLRQTVDGQ